MDDHRALDGEAEWVLRGERECLAGVDHRGDGDAADGVGHGCGLSAAGQTRIYWNGPFKMQLEPPAEAGISFRWGESPTAPGKGVPEPDLRKATTRPNELAESEESEPDAKMLLVWWSWGRIRDGSDSNPGDAIVRRFVRHSFVRHSGRKNGRMLQPLAVDCPRCRLANPPGNAVCDCGYTFTTGVTAAPIRETSKSGRNQGGSWFQRVWVGPTSVMKKVPSKRNCKESEPQSLILP